MRKRRPATYCMRPRSQQQPSTPMIQPNRMMATAMPMKPAVILRRSEERPEERVQPSVPAESSAVGNGPPHPSNNMLYEEYNVSRTQTSSTDGSFNPNPSQSKSQNMARPDSTPKKCSVNTESEGLSLDFTEVRHQLTARPAQTLVV